MVFSTGGLLKGAYSMLLRSASTLRSRRLSMPISTSSGSLNIGFYVEVYACINKNLVLLPKHRQRQAGCDREHARIHNLGNLQIHTQTCQQIGVNWSEVPAF